MADDLRSLAKSLRLLAVDEFAVATAAAINRVARAAHSASMENIRREFTLRNKYTLGSMMYYKATPKKDANKIDAITGTRSRYLDEQEVGGVAQTKDGKPAKLMPSKASRSGVWKTKSILQRYRLNSIGDIAKRKSKKMTPQTAKAFFLQPTENPGAKWLRGLRRLDKSAIFIRRGGKLIWVRVLTFNPIQLKATHWHGKARDKFGRQEVIDAAYRVELEKGLTKIGAR